MEKTGVKRISRNDIELVELALKSDQSAFSSLLVKYREALLSFISKFVIMPEDAEDICQRTFEKAFMNISQYNHQFAFSTWLYNIARNEAIDHLRRNRNTIASTSMRAQNEALNVVAASTPEDEFIIEQAVNQLKESIANLPDSYRVIAELRFIRDYAYEEIARKLDLPLGTVKTRINRARKMLIKSVETPDYGRDS
ncbi:MAG: sigma-70 family RNA polymerase sigma factor [Bacteroidales bacterium]|nr:sigma-70 family RNA polymerase sigma factor [Candidatus Cacconaster equi]